MTSEVQLNSFSQAVEHRAWSGGHAGEFDSEEAARAECETLPGCKGISLKFEEGGTGGGTKGKFYVWTAGELEGFTNWRSWIFFSPPPVVLSISGNTTIDVGFPELRAVGSDEGLPTPQPETPRRHFIVADGSTLRLKDLRLTGGQVGHTLVSVEPSAYGGSILVSGAKSMLDARSVSFAGCDATGASKDATSVICAYLGGAVHGQRGAEIKIQHSTFGRMSANHGGALSLTDRGTKAWINSTWFISNVATSASSGSGGSLYLSAVLWLK